MKSSASLDGLLDAKAYEANVAACQVTRPHFPALTMTTLHDLENHQDFHARHIGPNDAEIDEMLRAIGASSLDAMVDAIVPESIKLRAPLALPAAINEEEALARIGAIAAKQPASSATSSGRATTARHTQGHPAQHPREPGLVHRLHAVPGRDLAGPDGSADQLPDDGRPT